MSIWRLLVLVVFVAVSSTQVYAAEGESIVMSPATTRLQLSAGETREEAFTIINDGTTTLRFDVYVSPYSVDNKTYYPNYTATPANADLYTWVTFDKKDYQLKPGDSVKIPYAIHVPSDAAPGGHYSVIFAETRADTQPGGQIKRQKRVGSILYGTVKGDYISAGKDKGAQIDWLQLGGRLQASVRIDNSGNSDFVADTLFRVQNVFGATSYELRKEFMILPKTTRDIVLDWSNGPTIGVYKVTVETKVLDDVTTHQGWVLLMPLWLLILVVLGVSVLVYLAVTIRRR